MPALSIESSAQIEESLRSSLGASRGKEQNLADLLFSQSRAILLKKIDFVEAARQTSEYDNSVKSKYKKIVGMADNTDVKKTGIICNGEHKKGILMLRN
jgi:hypothetical protein